MSNPTQNFIPIEEVRDGIVVLKGGGLRALLLVSSINFDLKSEDEQGALLAQFRNTLNSIEFPIQFFVQSRLLDIEPYLKTLSDRLKEVTEELLQIQIREYIEFIKWFTDQTNIMKKNFFVVVPFDSAIISNEKGVFRFLSNLGGNKSASNERFEEARSQLEQRVSIVQQGLSSMGVRGVQLGTQEAVEVYYQIFNPGDKRDNIIINE